MWLPGNEVILKENIFRYATTDWLIEYEKVATAKFSFILSKWVIITERNRGLTGNE